MYSKTLILGALQLCSMTGYEIRKLCTEGSFSYFSELSYGSIYPMLARLEKEGLVNSIVEEQTGKPDKKVYSISPAGEKAYREALSKMQAPDVMKSEFCLLVISADLVEPEHMKKAIEVRKRYYHETLQMIKEVRETQCEQGKSSACHDWLSAYGEHIAKAHLAFLEEHGEQLVTHCGLNTKQIEFA